MNQSSYIRDFRKLRTELLRRLKKNQSFQEKDGLESVQALVEEMNILYEDVLRGSMDEVESLHNVIHSFEDREREAQKSIKNLMSILKISGVLRNTEHPKDILKTLIMLFRKVVPLNEADLFLWDEAQNSLVPMVERGGSPHLRELVRTNIEEGIMDWVMAEQETRILAENEIVSAEFDSNGNKSYIYIPIVSRGENIGIMIICSNVSKSEITKKELDILNLMTDQATSAIEIARMHQRLKESVRILNEFRRLSEKAERDVTARDW